MPLTDATRAELRRLYNALADRVLEPGDPVYLTQLNARESADAIAEIAVEIDFQEGGGVSLFTGQRGTGKSTELKRLKKLLEDQGVVVFYADLAEYLLMTKEVEISDFLVSMAGALSDQIEARYHANPNERSYWRRFADFMRTRVAIDELGVSFGPMEFKASLKDDPVFKKRVQESARGHVAALVKDAHGYIADAVQFVRACEHDASRKVVLLVDSVERIRGVGSEAMDVYESVRNLFFGHAEHLRVPLLHVVYTVPPYLAVFAAGAGTLLGGAVARRLVSTHIFKDRSRDPDPEGLATLRAVVAARHPEWSRILSAEALDAVALNSGGDLREFFRLVRLCLTSIRDDAQLPIPVAGVRAAMDAARNEMLPIPADHLAWLKRISQTHDTCLEKDADLPTLAQFLDNRLVLNYRNGADWYDVHPLIRDVVDAHGRPDA